MRRLYILENEHLPLKNKAHKGVILDVSSNRFDKGSVAFGSVFIDEDDPGRIFLFYSGSTGAQWSHSAIGLAVSDDGIKFRKIEGNPILEGTPRSFCYREALTPTLIRISNRFYMIFSGRFSSKASRRIGLAYSDDPKGPWQIIGELLKPTCFWEGMHIDNGPSLVKIDKTTFLVFYSNVTRARFDIPAFLRRYPIRKIGIAKVRIRGPSISQIEVHKLATNPLKHLNGQRGAWNESLFCPGYFKSKSLHYLFPATSTYSAGFPYKQSIGIASSDTPYFHKSNTYVQKLIDGPGEKHLIIPNSRTHIALDSPSPLANREKTKLFLYYSVADYADYKWKMALTTFDLAYKE
jgi:hypothetical protein